MKQHLKEMKRKNVWSVEGGDGSSLIYWLLVTLSM